MTNPQEESTTPYVRPSWDQYFLSIVKIVGSRGTCDRFRGGCVITKDKRIVATGYAGSPVGLPHCDEVGHEMHSVTNVDGSVSRHCVRTIHAEQNAICEAARRGIALEGGTLYCQMTPCYVCAKMLINAGIKRVVCAKDYHAGTRSKEIFKEAQINYELVEEAMTEYADQ